MTSTASERLIVDEASVPWPRDTSRPRNLMLEDVVGEAPDLDLVIPAFNESARLPATLLRTLDYLERVPWRTRVVVVDNGSADDTAGIVRDAAAGRDLALSVIGCARPGKGAAVRRGLLNATAQYVGFFDADLATPLETLDLTMSLLRDGATAVVASRHAPGAAIVRQQPWGRRIGGGAFRLLTQGVVHGIHDTQCGFKFFERSAVTRALVRCRTNGFAFDAELLGRIQAEGGRIVEVPVAWADDSASTFRPLRDGVASFRAVLDMRAGTR